MSLKIVQPNSPPQNNQNYQQSFLFRSLIRILGFTAAQSVISYVCVTTGTPKSEFFSNYETFSKLIIQAYGDAGQKHVLDKFPNTK
jgi:hypothetical protein